MIKITDYKGVEINYDTDRKVFKAQSVDGGLATSAATQEKIETQIDKYVKALTSKLNILVINYGWRNQGDEWIITSYDPEEQACWIVKKEKNDSGYGNREKCIISRNSSLYFASQQNLILFAQIEKLNAEAIRINDEIKLKQAEFTNMITPEYMNNIIKQKGDINK